MLKIQNVGAFPGGDAFLLDDGSGACLLDTGFGFCGEALAVHVRRALAERPLDAILLTHSHYDHFDRAAIDDVTTRHSIIVCDKTSAEAFEGDCVTMVPGAVADPIPQVHIEAVAAYNTTEGHTDFHPKEREDCGYILTIAGLRIYIAGDTEDTPEVLALHDIDAAFLPVNQPYTMTVDQAVRVVKAIRPRIFYPYHYGEVEEKTDIDRLKRELEGVTDVRVFPME